MSRYLMEDPIEAERLEIKTKRKNILRELECISLKPGMRILDIGCGTGAVTRILAEKTFPGFTMGLDFSPHRLGVARKIVQEEKKENIHFVCSDLLTNGVRPGRFDLVFSRCTFQYFAGDRGRKVLQRMMEWARPGGRVVVADLDGVCLYRVPYDVEREKGLDVMFEKMASMGVDTFIGRKLYGMFLEAGFQDIKVDLLPYYLIAGKADDVTIRVWEMKVEILKENLEQIFGSKNKANELTDRFLDDFKREDVLLYNHIFIVQGKKPQPV